MNAERTLQEVMELDAKAKATWPNGWASLSCGHGNWSALVHDNDMKCKIFSADDPSDALAQARDYIAQNRPMTTERLASILGIEVAA